MEKNHLSTSVSFGLAASREQCSVIKNSVIRRPKLRCQAVRKAVYEKSQCFDLKKSNSFFPRFFYKTIEKKLSKVNLKLERTSRANKATCQVKIFYLVQKHFRHKVFESFRKKTSRYFYRKKF